MKRCFYFLMAAIGLLLSTACSNEDELSRDYGNEAMVSFNVELSGGMQTKAISDGTTANRLIVKVFDESMALISDISREDVEVVNKSVTVSFNLVKGKTYSFLFWAAAENSPYTIGDDGTITVNYDNATANDENRDAFLGVVKNKTVAASFEEKVSLQRPFAQLNFLTNDIDAANKAGLKITEATQSSIKISNAATILNPFTNTVSGEQEVTFAAAAIPEASETYNINDKSYRYLGTTYLLVNAGGENADAGKEQTTLSSANLKVDGVQGDGLTVSNVPVQWNYRTNIYGSLLTATGIFNVTIDPDYEKPDNDESQFVTVDKVGEAIQNGATEVFVTEAPTEDATITIPKMFETDNETTISIFIPETKFKVTVSEGTGDQNAPKALVVSCPDMSELEINLPNSTVTLNGQNYTSVTATTADNTLIIPENVKVSKLTVNQGNVEIYGQFDIQIEKADRYRGTITYFVSTAEQLAALAAKVNEGTSFSNEVVKLANDIDLKKEEWTPIGIIVFGKIEKPFSGTFDGCGHTISNLYINKEVNIENANANMGLFGYTTNGKVMNFTLHNVNVKAGSRVGAVAGVPSTSSFSHITLTGVVRVEGYTYVGGMLGWKAAANSDNLTINVNDGSYVKAESENHHSYVGGLVGHIGEGDYTISYVQSNIDVIGSTCDVGGITGAASSGNTFENCVCTGDVTLVNATYEGNYLEIGGIAGSWMNYSGGKLTFRNCNFTGTLKSAFKNEDKSDEVAENRYVGRKYESDRGDLNIE